MEHFQAFGIALNDRTTAQQQLVEYSDQLIAELRSTNVIVMGVPTYNFSVPSVLRAYFDHIARAGETFSYTADGPEGLLKGKTARVFITRGGIYGEDHTQTQYLRQFLGFIGITDVKFIHAERLAMGESTKLESLDAAKKKSSQLLSA